MEEILAKLRQGKRKDGRCDKEQRRSVCEFGLLSRSDGSARYTVGGYSAVAGVQGPLEATTSRQMLFDRCAVEVIVRPARGIPSGGERLAETAIQLCLESMIDLQKMPMSVLQVTVQGTAIDGCVLPVLFNACVLAVLDASVPLLGFCLATAASVFALPGGSSVTVIDPTADEMADSEATVALAADVKTGKLAFVHLVAGRCLEPAQWEDVCSYGVAATQLVEAEVRRTAKQRLAALEVTLQAAGAVVEED